MLEGEKEEKEEKETTEKSESEEAAAECDYKQISWLERKSIVEEERERSLSVSFA